MSKKDSIPFRLLSAPVLLAALLLLIVAAALVEGAAAWPALLVGMAISFNSMPSNQRAPGSFVEIDSSKAQQGPAIVPYKAIIIGQKLAGGTQAADTIVRCTSVDQAITYGGRGSMLHRMALAWFSVNKSTELWLGVLADNGAGVAAQGTITVTVTTALAGTIALYLGGERITVGVNAGDAQNTIATNIAAAITAAPDLPITASAATNVVTWTFRHKGVVGQGYNTRDSYNFGEALPGGVSLVHAATTAGTTNPVLTNLIAAMADIQFHIWAHPYTDATSLTAIENELEARFGPTRQQQGLAITSAIGSFSTLAALGVGRNSKQNCIQAQASATPLTPQMEFAAETAALVALYGAAAPSRPFQTLQYVRAVACPENDLFDATERNLLLFTGISTSLRAAGGKTQIERVVTTYETSPSGAGDTAYLDATTMLTLLALRYTWRVRVQTNYPRHMLANDGTRIGAGQAVVTPKIMKGEALMWFRAMEEIGLVENFDQFKRDLVIERNISDPNRLDELLPVDLINQFMVNATQIQFRL